MRVQLHHQFFAGPEAPGPAQPRKLVRLLADRGHQIDVIACDFNVYSEATEPVESGQSESGGSWVVHRLSVPRRLRASLTARLKTYGSFAVAAYRHARQLATPDLVVASIQPLFSGYAAYRVSRRTRAPFVLEVRDLWPDALVVRQVIPGWQAGPLEHLARTLYHRATRIVSVTPGIRDEIVKKGIPHQKIDVFPTSFDAELFDLPADTRDRVRARLGWGDAFVAVYTGTHTEVTAVDVIVRAAAALRDRPNIRLDLFGSGQSKPAAIELAAELGLQNIHFHDPVPKTMVPEIVTAADVGLMSLFRSPLINIYFENKLIDYMGTATPIAAAMDGHQASIIEAAGAGRTVPSLDHDGLARLIVDAESDRPRWRDMGRAGRRYVAARLRQSAVLENYASMLETVGLGRELSGAPWDPFS